MPFHEWFTSMKDDIKRIKLLIRQLVLQHLTHSLPIRRRCIFSLLIAVDTPQVATIGNNDENVLCISGIGHTCRLLIICNAPSIRLRLPLSSSPRSLICSGHSVNIRASKTAFAQCVILNMPHNAMSRPLLPLAEATKAGHEQQNDRAGHCKHSSRSIPALATKSTSARHTPLL